MVVRALGVVVAYDPLRVPAVGAEDVVDVAAVEVGFGDEVAEDARVVEEWVR